MKQVEIVIENSTGLHARPAKVLVNLAKQFKSNISIQHGAKRVNAKSMVSVLTLGAVKGSLVTLEAAGEDEEKAIQEISSAMRGGLGDVEPPAAAPREEPPAEASVSQTTAKPLKTADAPAGSVTEAGKSDRAKNILRGIGAAPGIAVGPVFHFKQMELDIENREPPPGSLSLNEALAQAKDQLKVLYQRMVDRKLAAEAAIFDAHGELLDDPELVESAQERVKKGENPLSAWRDAVEERAAAIGSLKDTLLAARADDLRDVGRRVLRLMLGMGDKGITLPDYPVIVIAEELAPSDTAMFDAERVLGFAIVNGGPTSHIAILARAMGLPAVVGAEEAILKLEVMTQVALNGNDGTLAVSPSPETLARVVEEQRRWLEERRTAQEQASNPAVTLDGYHVDVTANAGSDANAVEARKKGADGIGLLRTEFLFLERTTAPSEEEQFGVYRAIAETMQNLPVIVRTLDIGGDKPVPYIQMKPELNPFLGERGIRLCLNRPDLFRQQLCAILRAAPHGNLKIMFPMVSDVAELRRAKALLEEIRLELNLPAVQVGIMIEVPSAALLAEKFAPEVDFFSIGTNDLTQYTLAVDRGHPALAAMHDGLHPAVLRLIAHTIESAHRYGKRADICGELGSDAAAVPVLIGLGMDELSVSIPSVPTVKAQVRRLRMSELQPLAKKALECASAREVRDLVRQELKM